MPEMADFVVSYALFVRLRFCRWDEVLAVAKPHTKLVASDAHCHWGRAIALAARHNRTAALHEAELFRSGNPESQRNGPG